MTAKQEDHWSSAAYQNSASFVPKLATKVLEWLDVQEGDSILDVGCGGEFSILFAFVWDGFWEVIRRGCGQSCGKRAIVVWDFRMVCPCLRLSDLKLKKTTLSRFLIPVTSD